MATYKESVGTSVTNFSGDYPGAVEGEVWYDTTDQVFKLKAVTTTSVWTTSANLNTGRQFLQGAGVNSTAALVFGGQPSTAVTESYNGTAWTEVNDLGTARYGLAGCGTNTAALAFGGEVDPPISNKTELWNGTNWTEVNDLNTARDLLAGAGTQTSALAFGGKTFAATGATESWNGTNWTELADLANGRFSLAGCGTANTSALAFGGDLGPGNTPEMFAGTEAWIAGPATATIGTS